MLPYYDEENIALRHLIFNYLGEVITIDNGVNVHENAVSAEMTAKTIIQTASVSSCLLPPVADKDATVALQ